MRENNTPLLKRLPVINNPTLAPLMTKLLRANIITDGALEIIWKYIVALESKTVLSEKQKVCAWEKIDFIGKEKLLFIKEEHKLFIDLIRRLENV